MKKMFKKNQLIIAALAVMIAAAGYLNYSGTLLKSGKADQTESELASQELLDISEEDLTAKGEVESAEEGEVDGTPGETVLTSGNVSSIAAQAKVSREQVRAKNKETLQAIIDDESVAEAQKAEAIAQMVEMTETAEMEVTIETLLASKGFTDSVVSIAEDSVDVVVDGSDLTDAKRAQIEDIVTRKSGVNASNVVINPIHSEESAETK